MNPAIVLIVIIIIAAVDVWFYSKARYPERMKNFLFQLPGGGIAAYFICGKN